ncbi:hypothetical protein [Shewanella violacea]|uniref:hypothetical protein n=1 Tax=Shewanella violacea TaxID=60217 RepID=UPI0012F7BEE1|nr:hypothetical protein [Shewanella violacea]
MGHQMPESWLHHHFSLIVTIQNQDSASVLIGSKMSTNSCTKGDSISPLARFVLTASFRHCIFHNARLKDLNSLSSQTLA